MENNACKICPYCGTANNAEYIYCKHCGNPLGGAPAGQYDTVNGVPVVEIADYIGVNSDKFIGKFMNFSRGAKASWNWPVFLFGFFLHMPFVWFFHRKMYKIGALVLAISAAFTICSTALTIATLSHLREPLIGYMENVYSDSYYDSDLPLYSDESEFDEFWDDYTDMLEGILEDGQFVRITMFSQVLSIAHLAFLIVISIYANHIYYKKAFNDLSRLNGSGFPSPAEVVNAGGTSKGIAVLTGVLFGIILIAASVWPIMSFVTDAMFHAFSPLA